jgi:bacterioferritin (cytochrome b1)
MKITYEWPDGQDPRRDVPIGRALTPEETLKHLRIQQHVVEELEFRLTLEKAGVTSWRRSLRHAVEHQADIVRQINDELSVSETSE